MIRASRNRRAGVALVTALVALTVVSAVSLTVAWQVVACRRQEARRQNEVQAGWLARAGVELAIDGLLRDGEKYRGETAEPLPETRVSVRVEPVEGGTGSFRVTSEARIPADSPRPLVRSVTRVVRRVEDGGTARVEVLP